VPKETFIEKGGGGDISQKLLQNTPVHPNRCRYSVLIGMKMVDTSQNQAPSPQEINQMSDK
jgi:glycerol-3-phosphate cytidylyltransferase-like family protein